ncbi:amino acid ABC transporter substrate-binding protein [Desulforhopalus sp. IMCC35007]|uniref:amino acid ABC transporter substrate-binding protein n=1 Tax=Desulforhopalus sp. IMCC35007 TaxID=2569543 RepID=UPI0010ADF8EC|nr:amino acid ABC transporter substrate-binding protein [Desulforhopalus sp. IMCC35007]TKB08461.1 amino acid ABC transporter substrate-binding protein [Desulforhopalus sp. IMCC35007]
MKIKIWMLSLLLTVSVVSLAHGYTREEIIKRGYLQCGVSTGVPGFSTVDSKGHWSGFDVDFCRAVAVATLGDASKVELLPLASGEAYTALLSGKVDLLSRQAEWTFSRDSALSVHFVGVSYYDAQGFLVMNRLGAQEVKGLKKARVCVAVDSDEAARLMDYSERNFMDFKPVPYESWDLAIKGFGGACDIISLKKSRLYGIQKEMASTRSSEILTEEIAKEPLGPVVRQGDDVWFNIVRWTLFAMINGEELGVTMNNVEEMKISNSLVIKRFFGLEGNHGNGIGLDDDWAAEIIRQVGNYGEVFERNLGQASSLKIERGLNNLWNQGGLQYAPPLR